MDIVVSVLIICLLVQLDEQLNSLFVTQTRCFVRLPLCVCLSVCECVCLRACVSVYVRARVCVCVCEYSQRH